MEKPSFLESLLYDDDKKIAISGILWMFAFLSLLIQKDWSLVLSFFFIYGAIIIAQDYSRMILKAILCTLLIVFIFIIVVFWWTGKNQLFGYPFEITDNKMLVIGTFIYAILTLYNVQSIKSQFDISRLPILEVTRDGFYFDFINVSKFITKDLRIKIKILYPLSKGIINYLKSSSKLEKTKTEYFVGEILPNKKCSINLEDVALEVLPIENIENYGPTRYELGLVTKKPFKFDILLSYSYKSDTDYRIPKEIEERYRLSMDGMRITARDSLGNPRYIVRRIT